MHIDPINNASILAASRKILLPLSLRFRADVCESSSLLLSLYLYVHRERYAEKYPTRKIYKTILALQLIQ